MLYPWHLAQLQDGGFPITGGEADAMGIVTQALALSRNTAQEWNIIWSITLDPLDGGLWTGLVQLGLVLAAASVLFLALTSGKEILEKQSWSELVSVFIWPLVIVMFLGSNGHALARTTLFIRNLGYAQVQSILDLQLGEMTFRNAVSQVGISTAARQSLETLYSECQGMVGAELVTCWDEKAERARAIIEQAEAQARTPLDGLQTLGDVLINRPLIGAIGQVITNPQDGIRNFGNNFDLAGSFFKNALIPIIRLILSSLQWAFVNMLEAALLLTALFGPIALGLSLLPLQGRPIWAWLTGFISLFGVQLGYNIIVGLVAVVVVRAGGELATDIAFLAFLSIFSPALALLIAGGGGIALYNGISNNVKSVIDFASSAVGAVTRIAIKAKTGF
jgi:hypothetical protein